MSSFRVCYYFLFMFLYIMENLIKESTYKIKLIQSFHECWWNFGITFKLGRRFNENITL